MLVLRKTRGGRFVGVYKVPWEPSVHLHFLGVVSCFTHILGLKSLGSKGSHFKKSDSGMILLKKKSATKPIQLVEILELYLQIAVFF